MYYDQAFQIRLHQFANRQTKAPLIRLNCLQVILYITYRTMPFQGLQFDKNNRFLPQ